MYLFPDCVPVETRKMAEIVGLKVLKLPVCAFCLGFLSAFALFNYREQCIDILQGGHDTGKTGNLVLTFSRQGKHREFCCNTGKIF